MAGKTESQATESKVAAPVGGVDASLKFNEPGDFAALSAAQKWCRDHGISYGSLQGPDPVGLMVGDYAIAKWRNLSAAERAELDGQLTGDKRNGPVFIQLTNAARARIRATGAAS